MKIKMDVILNLKTKEVIDKVNKATKKAIKDVVVDIANDVINIHPWKTRTGNNSRSIKYEVGPGGDIATKEGQGAIYGTSGYSGWLEVGTRYHAPMPYFKPALDRNINKLASGMKAELK